MSKLRKLILSYNPEAELFNGADSALIGITTGNVPVYSAESLITYWSAMGMSSESATHWVKYQMASNMGSMVTPLIIWTKYKNLPSD